MFIGLTLECLRKHENAQSQSPKGAEFPAFPKGRLIGQPKQRHDY
jgi:hypothetical protein